MPPQPGQTGLPSVSGQRRRKNTFTTPPSDMRMTFAALSERAAAESRKCCAMPTCRTKSVRPSCQREGASTRRITGEESRQWRQLHNAAFTGDGAYDREDVYDKVTARHPEAAVIVPPRSSAVPSATAETAPTQRDRHLQAIAEHGRLGWQKASGYNLRALVEAAISRYKRVIGDTLRSQTNGRQATEVAVAVGVLNRMLELGRPESVRIA